MKPEGKLMKEKKKRVVIVEDHLMLREHILSLINNEQDLEVCGETDNIRQGMEMIRTTLPDIAVVDIALSEGENGLEIVKSLKMLSLPIPVLVLSMHEELLYAERSLRAGAKGYITKHRASHELLLAIRRVLDGGIYVSEKIVFNVLQKMTSSIPSRNIDTLSDRELAVLEHIGHGRSSRSIAETLGLGVATVDTYRARIKDKMNLQNSFELQDFAIRWLRERD
jgi:DNA-binding NarL/FixJ family response regulator